MSYLSRLESESIHILREVVAECQAPVMLYSVGKDSSVMLHLARKAFYPAPVPFPLLHIDTGWKFREMLAFRDETTRRFGLELLVHRNVEGEAAGVNPFDFGSSYYTQVMKTDALKQAMRRHGFDAAFGGARRDEEISRAKERVVSFRSKSQEWDPKKQRPEFWQVYNSRVHEGESIRVFPLSNWTELDIWTYIEREDIDVVPLYFAREHAVVERAGSLLVVHDERMGLGAGEVAVRRRVRFRSLGCYPLTGAVESAATTLPEIIAEMREAAVSERGGRVIDRDEASSMERKKREGYF